MSSSTLCVTVRPCHLTWVWIAGWHFHSSSLFSLFPGNCSHLFWGYCSCILLIISWVSYLPIASVISSLILGAVSLSCLSRSFLTFICWFEFHFVLFRVVHDYLMFISTHRSRFLAFFLLLDFIRSRHKTHKYSLCHYILTWSWKNAISSVSRLNLE